MREATMSIRQDIERELKRIQAVSGRGLLQVDVPEGRIEADLVAVDAIGCAFQTLAYSTSLLGESSLEALKQVSHALTERLTSLLQPIGVGDAGPDRCPSQPS